MAAEEYGSNATQHPTMSRSSSRPSGKPKGILKNAPVLPSPGSGQHLQWDEQNIALTEIQKDSLMKITEPKTPYVRYNAETDEIEGDIPDLSLGHRAISPVRAQSPQGLPGTMSENGSRRSSFSNGRRASSSGRSTSQSSSRSTSFSLPTKEFIGKDVRGRGGAQGAVEVEEEMDEEAAAKHAAFVKARGRHYSNEAEAMKKAQQMMDDEDDEKTKVGANMDDD